MLQFIAGAFRSTIRRLAPPAAGDFGAHRLSIESAVFGWRARA